MSFHWNLSSEDELEGENSDSEECEKFHSNFAASVAKTSLDGNIKPTVATVTPAKTILPNNQDEDSDDCDVDWEDVMHESEDGGEITKPVSLRPVTIHLEENKETDRSKKRRKRTRTKFRNSSLAPDLSQFLLNLHKVNLMCLISGALLMSRYCSDDQIQHLSNSLLPLKHNSRNGVDPPTLDNVKNLCKWYFELVNGLDQRRKAQMQENVLGGAPLRRRHQLNKQIEPGESISTQPLGEGEDTSLAFLTSLCSYLSRVYDEDPQLITAANPKMGAGKIMLLIAMLRSIAWRVRYVTSLDPMSKDLDVNHPLFLSGAANVLTMMQKNNKKSMAKNLNINAQNNIVNHSQDHSSPIAWVEILCHITLSNGTKKMKWVSVDVDQEWIDEPRKMEALNFARQKRVSLNPKRRQPIVYGLGVEHLINMGDGTLSFRLTDVTPRYANSWSHSQKLRGDDCHVWFGRTISDCNRSGSVTKKIICESGLSSMDAIPVLDSDEDETTKKLQDDVLEAEQAELIVSGTKEIMPTNKADFKNHATFALVSQLKSNEVLAPEAKEHICGIFKGEIVYHRKVVSVVRTAKKWLYKGRKVMENVKPIKRVKARKKPGSNANSFKTLSTYGVGSASQEIPSDLQPQLSNNMDDLFAVWQTEDWSPHYVGRDDDIPVNEYRNVELALLNPGLVHIDRTHIAKVAKRLGM